MTTAAPPSSPLRVSGSSDPHAVAAKIAHALYDGQESVSVRAIGAGAVNQAVKAISIASNFVSERGLSLSCKMSFETVQLRSRTGSGLVDVSAIVFYVFSD